MRPHGILLIEGADAAGKTTLANAIRARYPGTRYLHSIVRKECWRWHLGALHLAHQLADENLVILDRHWLSEQAYGQVFRGGPQYDAAARIFDRVLLKAGAITVLCAPADIKKQLARHGDLKTKRPEKFDNIAKVAQLYLDLRMGNLAHPGNTYLDQLIRFGDYNRRPDVWVYDVDEDGACVDKVARMIVEDGLYWMHRSQYPDALFSYHYNVTGFLKTATHVLVGEHVSPAAKRHPFWPMWPFTANDIPPSSAQWLNGALHDAAIDETKFMMTNACDLRDPHLGRLYLAKPSLKFVALGDAANKCLIQQGIVPWRKIPHPQYYRRFKSKMLNEYGQLLREALR